MKVIKLKNLSRKDYQRIMQRSFGTNEEIIPQVKKIIENVKRDGDQIMLKKYQARFGKENYRSVQVTEEEIAKAYKEVDQEFITALKQMIKNISAVQKAQLPKKVDTVVKPEKGISVWRVWRPIEKIGLYVPGGKAVYPSSVLMTAIPAKIAGCREIILCSPPKADGQIPAPTLVAADMLGLKKIFKVGGVEAIAAMAYGTESIPKIYKIFGAGNSFVTAAKISVFPKVAIDMPAGPSEVLILADESANPAWVVADLLADAEHGPDSACIIVTVKTQNNAENCVKEIEKQINNLSTKDRIKESFKKYGLILTADTFKEAIDFINDYAPEHLEIMTGNPEKIVSQIQNAGSVFLGDWTTKSSGDYATGANHVLPTGGMAKMYPPLGVDAFGKWMQVQKCTRNGLSRISETIEIMADIEQLPAHKNATSIRFI
ncbi:histidinol dehydrogenase [Candidatus Microgenomates bacterium]|nr:histidinol dehydrogenase [Candidatus Microgenomates bacterium]